jgi:hypothetical protein
VIDKRWELQLWVTWDNGFCTTAVAYTGEQKLSSAAKRSKIRLWKRRNPTVEVTGFRWRRV